mgnify:CR=1 FL=1
MAILARNKKAYFDYEVLEKYEAGLKLLGHEVKSVKNGRVSLKGSFVTIKKTTKKLPELYLINAHIPKYQHAGNVKDHDPYRSRKLLLNKKEIERLIGKKQEKGLTLVPLKLYTRHSLVKLEFGLARGKKKVDKREDIKRKDLDRQKRELLKKKIRRQ